MDSIRIYKHINTVNPVMIAGWPGMGSVATGVVSYLRKKLRAVKFAEIGVNHMTVLDSVMVENGLAKLPPPPQNVFYYSEKSNLIIFEGESQAAGTAGVGLVNSVLDLAGQFNTKMICTGAAFPFPISHKDSPQLYGAVNKKELAGVLRKFEITPMDGGHISGLNGLILGFAAGRNIDGICILATMPQYAISLPNPKASYAIIEVLQNMLGFHVDMSELGEHVRDMDEKMAVIEDRVKDVLTVEKDVSMQPEADKKVPEYIVDKIEKLFLDAKGDRTKAIVLKKELDRWDLYHTYEDRFLDLFKDKQ